jgi:hypothetical protein
VGCRPVAPIEFLSVYPQLNKPVILRDVGLDVGLDVAPQSSWWIDLIAHWARPEDPVVLATSNGSSLIARIVYKVEDGHQLLYFDIGNYQPGITPTRVGFADLGPLEWGCVSVQFLPPNHLPVAVLVNGAEVGGGIRSIEWPSVTGPALGVCDLALKGPGRIQRVMVWSEQRRREDIPVQILTERPEDPALVAMVDFGSKPIVIGGCAPPRDVEYAGATTALTTLGAFFWDAAALSCGPLTENFLAGDCTIEITFILYPRAGFEWGGTLLSTAANPIENSILELALLPDRFGRPTIVVLAGRSGAVVSRQDITNPPAFTWVSVALTVSAHGRSCQVYVNGIAAGPSFQLPQLVASASPRYLTFAASRLGLPALRNAMIHEARVWRTQRTPKEIVGELDALPLAHPDIVGYWTFGWPKSEPAEEIGDDYSYRQPRLAITGTPPVHANEIIQISAAAAAENAIEEQGVAACPVEGVDLSDGLFVAPPAAHLTTQEPAAATPAAVSSAIDADPLSFKLANGRSLEWAETGVGWVADVKLEPTAPSLSFATRRAWEGSIEGTLLELFTPTHLDATKLLALMAMLAQNGGARAVTMAKRQHTSPVGKAVATGAWSRRVVPPYNSRFLKRVQALGPSFQEERRTRARRDQSEDTDELKLVMFDVGHGDGLLVDYAQTVYKTPTSSAETTQWRMLVDAGKYKDVVRDVILPYLTADAASLDVVCATHPDADHVGGLVKLLQLAPQELAIDSLIANAPAWNPSRELLAATFTANGVTRPNVLALGEDADDPRWELHSYKQILQLRELAGQRHIPVNAGLISHGSPLPGSLPSKLRVEVTGPWLWNLGRYAQAPDKEKRSSELSNRTSITLDIDSLLNPDPNRHLLLLTGDAYDLAQPDAPWAAPSNTPYESVPAGALKTDIRGPTNPWPARRYTLLKVPHHGSELSDDQTFYNAVRADCYLISANGDYGLPKLATLRRIVEAPRAAADAIRIYATHDHNFPELVDACPPAQWNYELWQLAPGASSMTFTIRKGELIHPRPTEVTRFAGPTATTALPHAA